MAPTQVPSTIRIAPGQFADSATLIHGSALEDCTRIDGDAAGIFVERRWPTLSTGEELLWSLLSWLNGVGEQPTIVALADGLDAANLLAAMDAVDAGRGVTA